MYCYEQNLGKAYAARLPTLGQCMAEVLGFFGVQRIYGVGGDFAANLISAFETSLELCPSSNEMHAAFSACAQAELDGLGVCLTTYTVGSLPCMSAAALAMAENLPLVFISGAPGESEIGDVAIHHTVHGRSAWQTRLDAALQAFAGLGMRAERLQGQRNSGQPNMAGEHFLQLVNHAWQHRQPVFVEVPRDQVFALTQALSLPAHPGLLRPAEQVLSGAGLIAEEIARRLRDCKYPVLFIGDAVKHNPRLRAQLLAFCERLSIPFATSWFAKGLFDEFHPLCLGAYNGVFSDNPSRVYIEQQADYVLDVGSSIFSQDTNTAFSTGSHFIHAMQNKTVLKGTSVGEGDLIELFDCLAVCPLPSFDFTLPNWAAPAVEPQAKLDFHNLAQTLNYLQTRDPHPYLYLPEVGNSYFASYGLRNRLGIVGRGWLTNPWYGAMGTCLPYAREAARCIKGKQGDERVVVIVGDGGLHFQLNELIELQKDQTAVIIIYMRNNLFHLGKSSDAPIYYCNDPAFDVDKLISAYGGRVSHCYDVGQFCQAFAQAAENNQGMTLISVQASLESQYQCREITLLNLYIRSQNGDEQARAAWLAATG